MNSVHVQYCTVKPGIYRSVQYVEARYLQIRAESDAMNSKTIQWSPSSDTHNLATCNYWYDCVDVPHVIYPLSLLLKRYQADRTLSRDTQCCSQGDKLDLIEPLCLMYQKTERCPFCGQGFVTATALAKDRLPRS